MFRLLLRLRLFYLRALFSIGVSDLQTTLQSFRHLVSVSQLVLAMLFFAQVSGDCYIPPS